MRFKMEKAVQRKGQIRSSDLEKAGGHASLQGIAVRCNL
jgi:hypothetical protein